MRLQAVIAIWLLILAPAGCALAATVHFDGLTDGLTDGSRYISPFRLSIDGKGYQAMCYDLTHMVHFGETWQADLLSTSQVGRAYFADQPDAEGHYLEVIWLFTELVKTSDAEDRIGIQHAAWGLFSNSAPTAGAAHWLAEAAEAREDGFPGVDFSNYRIVNSVAGTTARQGFVVGGFSPATVTPEPGTTASAAIGVALVGTAALRRRRRA